MSWRIFRSLWAAEDDLHTMISATASFLSLVAICPRVRSLVSDNEHDLRAAMCWMSGSFGVCDQCLKLTLDFPLWEIGEWLFDEAFSPRQDSLYSFDHHFPHLPWIFINIMPNPTSPGNYLAILVRPRESKSHGVITSHKKMYKGKKSISPSNKIF
jgi:hypothetical protein